MWGDSESALKIRRLIIISTSVGPFGKILKFECRVIYHARNYYLISFIYFNPAIHENIIFWSDNNLYIKMQDGFNLWVVEILKDFHQSTPLTQSPN